MEKAIQKENRKKYHQSEKTCQFLHHPLKQQFGDYGEGKEAINLLAHNYTPKESYNQDVKEYLEVCSGGHSKTNMKRLQVGTKPV